MIFPLLEINENNNNNNNHNEKKIILGIIVFGLLPNYVVKKKKNLYCNTVFVRKRIEGCLYCNTIFCIVIEACVD